MALSTGISIIFSSPILLLSICCLLFSTAAFASSPAWGYGEVNGPSTWAGLCNSGSRQSPVNIQQSATAVAQQLGRLQFGNYGQQGPVQVLNNGHEVEVHGFDNWEASKRPFVQGGGLGAKYMLSQLHFHWSQTGNGSEHQINGRHFPVELHMVHVKEGFTAEEALKQSNGIAAVGVFYRVANSGRSMAGLEAAIASVKAVSEVSIASYSPSRHLPANRNNFFRYNGSLTTPECQEAVVWTVMGDQLSITQSQLDVLRAVQDAEGQPLATNVRPVQPLNGRKVEANC